MCGKIAEFDGYLSNIPVLIYGCPMRLVFISSILLTLVGCSESHLPSDYVAPDSSVLDSAADSALLDSGFFDDGDVVMLDSGIGDSSVLDAGPTSDSGPIFDGGPVVDAMPPIDSAVDAVVACEESVEPVDLFQGIVVESADFLFGCMPDATRLTLALSPNPARITSIDIDIPARLDQMPSGQLDAVASVSGMALGALGIELVSYEELAGGGVVVLLSVEDGSGARVELTITDCNPLDICAMP